MPPLPEPQHRDGTSPDLAIPRILSVSDVNEILIGGEFIPNTHYATVRHVEHSVGVRETIDEILIFGVTVNPADMARLLLNNLKGEATTIQVYVNPFGTAEKRIISLTNERPKPEIFREPTLPNIFQNEPPFSFDVLDRSPGIIIRQLASHEYLRDQDFLKIEADHLRVGFRVTGIPDEETAREIQTSLVSGVEIPGFSFNFLQREFNSHEDSWTVAITNRSSRYSGYQAPDSLYICPRIIAGFSDLTIFCASDVCTGIDTFHHAEELFDRLKTLRRDCLENGIFVPQLRFEEDAHLPSEHISVVADSKKLLCSTPVTCCDDIVNAVVRIVFDKQPVASHSLTTDEIKSRDLCEWTVSDATPFTAYIIEKLLDPIVIASDTTRVHEECFAAQVQLAQQYFCFLPEALKANLLPHIASRFVEAASPNNMDWALDCARKLHGNDIFPPSALAASLRICIDRIHTPALIAPRTKAARLQMENTQDVAVEELAQELAHSLVYRLARRALTPERHHPPLSDDRHLKFVVEHLGVDAVQTAVKDHHFGIDANQTAIKEHPLTEIIRWGLEVRRDGEKQNIIDSTEDFIKDCRVVCDDPIMLSRLGNERLITGLKDKDAALIHQAFLLGAALTDVNERLSRSWCNRIVREDAAQFVENALATGEHVELCAAVISACDLWKPEYLPSIFKGCVNGLPKILAQRLQLTSHATTVLQILHAMREENFTASFDVSDYKIAFLSEPVLGSSEQSRSAVAAVTCIGYINERAANELVDMLDPKSQSKLGRRIKKIQKSLTALEETREHLSDRLSKIKELNSQTWPTKLFKEIVNYASYVNNSEIQAHAQNIRLTMRMLQALPAKSHLILGCITELNSLMCDPQFSALLGFRFNGGSAYGDVRTLCTRPAVNSTRAGYWESELAEGLSLVDFQRSEFWKKWGWPRQKLLACGSEVAQRDKGEVDSERIIHNLETLAEDAIRVDLPLQAERYYRQAAEHLIAVITEEDVDTRARQARAVSYLARAGQLMLADVRSRCADGLHAEDWLRDNSYKFGQRDLDHAIALSNAFLNTPGSRRNLNELVHLSHIALVRTKSQLGSFYLLNLRQDHATDDAAQPTPIEPLTDLIGFFEDLSKAGRLQSTKITTALDTLFSTWEQACSYALENAKQFGMFTAIEPIRQEALRGVREINDLFLRALPKRAEAADIEAHKWAGEASLIKALSKELISCGKHAWAYHTISDFLMHAPPDNHAALGSGGNDLLKQLVDQLTILRPFT